MDTVPKPSDSECYTQTLEHFKFLYCWACIRYSGNVFTEPVVIGSDAMIFIPIYIMIGLGIQKLIEGYWGTKKHGDRISVFYFCRNIC
jgi:hypothetical protein